MYLYVWCISFVFFVSQIDAAAYNIQECFCEDASCSLAKLLHGIRHYEKEAIREAHKLPSDQQKELVHHLLEKELIQKPLYTDSTLDPVCAMAICPKGTHVIAMQKSGFFDAYEASKGGIIMHMMNENYCEFPLPIKWLNLLGRIVQDVESAAISFSDDGNYVAIMIDGYFSVGWSLSTQHSTLEFGLTDEARAVIENALKKKACNSYKVSVQDTGNCVVIYDVMNSDVIRNLSMPKPDMTVAHACAAPENSDLIVVCGSKPNRSYFYPFAQVFQSRLGNSNTTLPQAIALMLSAKEIRGDMSVFDRAQFVINDRKNTLQTLASIHTDPFSQFAQDILANNV